MFACSLARFGLVLGHVCKRKTEEDLGKKRELNDEEKKDSRTRDLKSKSTSSGPTYFDC